MSASNVLELGDSPIDGEFSGVWIYIHSNLSSLSALQWWFGSPDHDPSIETIRNVTVSGLPAIKVTLDEDIAETHVIVGKDSNIYEILRIGLDDKTFDSVLSSFTLR